MIRALIIIEDSQISFALHSAKEATVTVADGQSGMEKTVENVPVPELAAALALAIGSDELFGDSENEHTQALYELAEDFTKKFVDEDDSSTNCLRIIP
jgi:hypothetical protein